MNGKIEFLLDTNYILGLAKGHPILEKDRKILSGSSERFSVSVITWIELFSYPNITREEEETLIMTLSGVVKIPLTEAIERRTIEVRKARRFKLPDAIVLATCLECGTSLLTLDVKLGSAFRELSGEM